jgi:Tfp pilus assembly protein PilF
VTVHLRLNSLVARLAALTAVFGLCLGLSYLVLRDFVVSALTDERITITAEASASDFITAPFDEQRIGIHPDLLAAAAQRFPNSARLQLRLGEYEKYATKDEWRGAELRALRAIQLSPHDYRPRLLLASVQDYRQELEAAERSTREVLKLAPGNLEAHWQLATLLLRRGDMTESLQEFRTAASGHPTYFEEGLKEVWSAAPSNVDALRAITPDDSRSKLRLAGFLLEKSQVAESAAAFREIERDALLGDKTTAEYLASLIAGQHYALAHELWSRLVPKEEVTGPMRNGGFESKILVDFAQFDWSIQPSKYARISIDPTTTHSGKHSLRVDYIGLETTRLEDEIRQLTVVRPGARYRLRYYTKTDELSSPEGPRVVVLGTSARDSTAISEAAPQGTTDWHERTVDFTASGSTLIVSIKQVPRFSYEDPTLGTVWFDDFELREI